MMKRSMVRWVVMAGILALGDSAMAQEDPPVNFTGPNAGPLRVLYDLGLATTLGISQTQLQLVELAAKVEEVSSTATETQATVSSIAAFGAMQVETSCAGAVAEMQMCPGEAGDCLTMTYSCYPFGCNIPGTTCQSRCGANSDCAAGAQCESASQQCVPVVNTCQDSFSVRQPNGSIAACDGYRCVAGACQQQCQSNLDCNAGDGYSCVNHFCEK